MIRRSVPGYTTIVPMIGLIAARFARPGTACYDLGCSLGAVTLAMRHSIPDTDARIIAVDNAESMIERCQHYIAPWTMARPGGTDVCRYPGDRLSARQCRSPEFHPAVHPRSGTRPLLTRLRKSLEPGGALILSEKIAFADSDEQALHEALHRDFKRAQGYSEMEISRKRNALEEVLIPETLETHRQRLLDAGFAPGHALAAVPELCFIAGTGP